MATLSTGAIDALFAEWDRTDSPGAALGIIQDGVLTYARGYGMASLEYGNPITPKSVFYIASTSKQFTACCVALLAQQGRISLDDDIRKYFPEIPDYGHTITVRHLVHHTSGLRDYLAVAMLSGRFGDAVTDDDVVETIARQKAANFAPGEKYLYSNSGYVLMAILVQRVTGQSLREYADEHIFQPLGMAHTHFHDDRTVWVPQRAWGHTRRPDGSFGLALTPYDRVGDGGLLTCIEDLYLWDRSYTSHAIGGKELTDLRLTPGTLNSGEKITYAFGLDITRYRGLPVVRHAGGFYGYCCEYVRFPEQHTSVICLFNIEGPDPTALAQRMAELVLDDRYSVQKPAEAGAAPLPTPPAEQLRRLVGAYRHPVTGAVYQVELCDGKLTVGFAGAQFTLEPVAARRFRALQTPMPVELEFVYDGGDLPVSVSVTVGQRKAETLPRVEVVTYTADELESFSGRYTSEELDTVYRVSVHDGTLAFRYRHSGDLLGVSTTRDSFALSMGSVEYRRDADGTVTGFTLSNDRANGFVFVRQPG
jgi:CubicO group peptidase (beta-lactamase class C family)